MESINIEKFGKSDKYEINEEKRNREVEKLCKSMIKCVARHHRERRAVLATAEEHVQCIDDTVCSSPRSRTRIEVSARPRSV